MMFVPILQRPPAGSGQSYDVEMTVIGSGRCTAHSVVAATLPAAAGRQLTVEADAADVAQQLLPSGHLHVGTDARAVGTQVVLHVVEGVGHGINGVDHKLHLTLLLVLGVDADAFLS